MWRSALRTKGTTKSSCSLFSSQVSNSIPHSFCLCSSRACPNSSSSATISQQCVKQRRRKEQVELRLGLAKAHRKTIKSCRCQEGCDLAWVRRNSAITLLFPHPTYSHYSLLKFRYMKYRWPFPASLLRPHFRKLPFTYLCSAYIVKTSPIDSAATTFIAKGPASLPCHQPTDAILLDSFQLPTAISDSSHCMPSIPPRPLPFLTKLNFSVQKVWNQLWYEPEIFHTWKYGKSRGILN